MKTLSNIWKCQRIITRNSIRILQVRNCHKEPIHVKWEKPDKGWTKLNFDGSCKLLENGKASIGGVLRNHDGMFLFGYAESIGNTTSTLAELVALRRGLELVLEYGWKDVCLEGDLKSMVEIIAKGRLVKCEETRLHVSHINSMMLQLRSYNLTHVYRQGNRVADKFADMGHNLEKPKVWLGILPDQVLQTVSEDAQGKCFIRKQKIYV